MQIQRVLNATIMKKLFFYCLTLTYPAMVNAQDIFERDFSKPEATELWEPTPKIVTPGIDNGPPSDALVLFSGENLDQWIMSKDGGPCEWNVQDGIMTVKTGTGDIQTRQEFGDCQLHIEFKIPSDAKNSP